MQNRPDVSLLKNTYLETYHAIEACLMQHNFSLLLPRKIENQVFDIMLTAQKQKVPTKKLECNKDLNKFCNNLIYEYNLSVSVTQQVLEGIFTFSLLIFFFTLLDVLFEKGILMSTLITCILIFIGYFISNTILRYKRTFNSKLRSLLILGIVLIPFVLMSFLKTKVVSLANTLPFANSLILTLLVGAIAAISYLILSKKYDLFVFVKRK
jgi:DNA-binding ferritin-like protein (Dps family)